MIGEVLAELVRIYCDKYRNPQLRPFVVHKPHTMTSWYNTAEATAPGCYAFYSEAGELLYVGKASLNNDMGARLAAHDHSKPRATWREKAFFVQFVSVTEPFESPSLEEFLIGKLLPTGNIRGGKPKASPSN